MTRKKYIFVFVILCAVAVLAFSKDVQPKLQEFHSPRLFGPAAGSTLFVPPQSSIQNPASAALTQRTTFDGNYIAVFGQDDTSSGWKGHALNFGHTIPTKIGVFTWNTGLLRSTFDSLDTGNRLSLHSSFAKDVYPDTLVGAGLGVSLGEGPEFGVDADLGLIRLRSSLWFMDDVRWSLALNNFGYSTIDDLREPLFSVSSGIQGRFLNKEKVEGRIVSELSVEEYSNVLWSTGVKFQFGYGVEASVGTRVNAKSLLDEEYGELVPSITLGYTYTPGTDNSEKTTEDLTAAERFTRNELQPYLSAAPIAVDLWAIGAGLTVPIGLIDEEAPEIKIDLSGVTKQYTEEEQQKQQDNSEDADKEEGSENLEPEEDPEEAEEEEDEISTNKIQTLKSRALSRAPKRTAKGGAPQQNTYTQVYTKQSKRILYVADSDEKSKGEKLTEELRENIIPEAEIYLSPNNDGVQDILTFPISIDESRYIKGFEFIVENSKGGAVRTILNKEKRPEKRTFKSFFQNLFKSKSGIAVPETLRWDGTTDSGEQAPDGLYKFYLRAWDDNGNYATSEKYSVYIDTQPPVVNIEKADESDRIFSPNNDGNKDVLPIEQRGTREDRWKAKISDTDGEVVRSFVWENIQPENFEWDGTNDEGVLVPDGLYEYSISATDRAGNSMYAEYDNLVKNTEATPISMRINHSHFSPNNNGVRDEVLVSPDVPVQRGIENWTVRVMDDQGTVHRTYSGKAGISGAIPFDGRNDQGELLPEKEYYARIEVLYINGNNPSAVSAPFVLDVTPPTAKVEIDSRIFSPNGDDQKDEINIQQEASSEDVWYGHISDIDGKIVYQYKWMDRPAMKITWDGRKEDGSLADDGYYFYQLTTVDRAGNEGGSSRVRFELNTEETPVLLTSNYDYFSPNGDGNKDTIKFLPKLTVKEGIVKYTLTVSSKDGEGVFTRSGSGDLPEDMQWDGFASTGGRVEDGAYKAEIEVLYENGNQPLAETQLFIIDTVFPEITVEPEYEIFSPEGDGYRDTVSFLQDSSEEDLWEGEIIDQEGEAIKRVTWQGNAEDFKWDGTDKAGNSVPDGVYDYRVYTTDKAGNRTEEQVDGIEVDTQPTKLFVTAGSEKLAPTGNGMYEDITFNTIVNRRRGLESWSLEMVDNEGVVRKSFEGENRAPKQIVWDGKSEDEEYLEGTYRARFSAEYTKGNRPTAESLPFVLDVSSPDAEVQIEPIPFSPDNDGVDDELSILLDVSDRNNIEKWSFYIYDAERQGVVSQDGPVFKEYSGRGTPAEEIIWDGRSDDGELVYAAMDYPYRFEVMDSLGNRRVKTGKIPVDVLVVREGDDLKIKISSINFKPNSAEFADDDPEIAARNEYVLNRLAEILKKYRQYEITIEGHANITKFWDPALAKEEQEEELIPLSRDRAVRVMEALTDRGISGNRLKAKGVGGSKPVVDFRDEENRWKNRRVEFILKKD